MDIQAYIQSGIIESYVLGLASNEETAELEQLRLQYPDLNRAIDNFSLMLERQALQNAVAPPPDIKEKVFSAIKEDVTAKRPVHLSSITVDKSINTTGKIRKVTQWKMMAAAAVILLITSAAFNIYLLNKYQQKNKAYLALLTDRNTLQASNRIYEASYNEWKIAKQIMADPAMAVIKMTGVAGKENNTATVYWNTKNRDVFIMPTRLPQPAKGKQYQLWALVNGQPVDAGILDPTCIGACKMKNIPKADAFAITLEKAGGSASPTIEEMYVKGGV